VTKPRNHSGIPEDRRVAAATGDAAGTRTGPHTVVFRILSSRPKVGQGLLQGRQHSLDCKQLCGESPEQKCLEFVGQGRYIMWQCKAHQRGGGRMEESRQG